jgi:protein-tyrosine phosphatase
MRSDPFAVLFVCTGNICRSPTAEGVFRRVVADAGLADRILTDSAGTISYHAGKPPDPRTVRAARRRGYDLGDLRARQVHWTDFDRFDLLLAMDFSHRAELVELGGPDGRDRVRMFLEFATAGTGLEVPDPYYGDGDGFESVLDLCEDASRGLLGHLREQIR